MKTDLREWTDRQNCATWEEEAHAINPLRREQIDILLHLVGDLSEPGDTLLDIGSGSGLVAEKILASAHSLNVLGLERSQAMMGLARERLQNFGSRFRQVEFDLEQQLDSIPLSTGAFAAAYTVGTFQDLAPMAQFRLISWIYNLLPAGGFFFFQDRIRVTDEELFSTFYSAWARWSKVYDVPNNRPNTLVAFEERDRQIKKSPLSWPELLLFMRATGFSADIIHKHAHTVILVGRKLGAAARRELGASAIATKAS